MKSWISRISYKMLVTTMITIVLSFFVVTSCAHANKFSDLVNDDGIYYTGTQDAKVTANKGIFTRIVNALSTIANYLLGLITLGIRGAFIGWIEIAEMLLTAILDIDNDLDKINEDAMDTYTENTVNVESILFNRVPILNANLFETLNSEKDEKKNTAKNEESTKEEKSATIVQSIKSAVAKWYYILRLLAIAFMLLLLIFVGIKMAISTVASEKAVYKQMLVDWVAGMIIVFGIHYMMIAIFAINDSVTDALEPLLSEKSQIKLEEYEYGIENENTTYDELETTLYESARTRAYSLSLTDGFTGLVIYGVLVYYAWRFAIMYFIRVLNIMILTLVAPIIAATYAMNKVMTGKSKIFSSWLSEYIINVIIRLFHVIIYVSFVGIALKLSMESLLGTILAFVLLHFMLEAEKMLRTLFKMSGGKGSLSGGMDQIGFKEIRSGIKGLGTAMVGGKVGMAAAKTTYRIATKPVRAGVEVAFGTYMAKKANEKEEEEKEIIEEKLRLEEEIANMRTREELEKEHKKWSKEQNMAYFDRDKEGEEYATQKLEKIEDEMAELQDKLDELEYRNELEKIENLEKKFSEGTLKGSIEDLFDPKKYATKGKDGKYHRKKTKRKGGANWAFWREKKDGIGKKFMENAKLAKLLNLSTDEVKELKNQFNVTKSTVLGFISAGIGFPALVIEPTLGIALLGQATYAGLGVATKARQLKNRPSYKKNKNYNFVSFNKGAQYTMQVEAARQIRELESERTQEIAGKHRNFVRKLLHNKVKPFTLPDLDPIATEQLAELGYFKFTKQFKTALKDLNELETTMNTDKFKTKFSEEEKNQKSQAEKMSKEQLLLNEYRNDDGVIVIGNAIFGIDIDNDAAQAEKKFVNEAEKKVDQKTDLSRAERIKFVRTQINDNKETLIQNQIEKYYARRGTIDISHTEMLENDKIEIKQNILSVLEEKGIIKKGEIKLDDNLISNQNVESVYATLQANKDKTNQSLEQRVATDAVLEYIAQTGITKKDELQQRTDEIYDVIKDKIMSEDSKKSADVIRQISGQDKKKEEINLSEYMKESVETDIKKLKRVDGLSTSKNKEKLVEHETNRRMNKTKNKLEEALCADTVENIDDEKTLEMLFALSKIGENNREAVEVLGKKQKEVNKAQLEKLEFYQDGSRKLDKNRDGSRRWDESKDGSQRVAEKYFMESKQKALEKRLFGPSQNVIDLINNV